MPEWGSINDNDGVLDQGLGPDQLVVGGVVHDVDDPEKKKTRKNVNFTKKNVHFTKKTRKNVSFTKKTLVSRKNVNFTKKEKKR